MLKPSRPAVVALLIAAPGLAVKLWDWLDRSNGLDAWLKNNGSTPLGQLVNEVLSVGWVFLFVGLLFWYHDSRGREMRTVESSTQPNPSISPADAAAPLDENALKRKITEQAHELYRVNEDFNDMRTQRDELSAKLAEVNAELASVTGAAQSQQRNLLQEIGDRLSKADSQKLLAELAAARKERDALSETVRVNEEGAPDPVLIEAQAWLNLRIAGRPAPKPGRPTVEILELGRYEGQTVATYMDKFASRMAEVHLRAIRKGKVRDPAGDDLLSRTPQESGEIQAILNYLRYLDTGT